jgi:hypothetical protein
MKICSVCHTTKDAAEFGVLLRNKDGLAGRCKPCARSAVAATKAKNGRGKCDPVKAKARVKVGVEEPAATSGTMPSCNGRSNIARALPWAYIGAPIGFAALMTGRIIYAFARLTGLA